jgi:hypothetical protein
MLALFMLLFLSKDWQEIVGWTTSHLGVSPPSAVRDADAVGASPAPAP